MIQDLSPFWASLECRVCSASLRAMGCSDLLQGTVPCRCVLPISQQVTHLRHGASVEKGALWRNQEAMWEPPRGDLGQGGQHVG